MRNREVKSSENELNNQKIGKSKNRKARKIETSNN